MKKYLCILLIVIYFFETVLCGYLIAVNKKQIQIIDTLSNQMEDMEETLALYQSTVVDTAALDFLASCHEDGYHYLAIGNSITKCYADNEIWRDEYGMAASSVEKDFYHLVLDYLWKKEGQVNSAAVLFYMWEIVRTNRAETYSLLEPYLNDKIDLITIQLGENATELSTFEEDMENLILHVKKMCPETRIILIGDFWEYEDRDVVKEAVAERCGVDYISLEQIKDKADYQCGIGTIIEDGRSASNSSWRSSHSSK